MEYIYYVYIYVLKEFWYNYWDGETLHWSAGHSLLRVTWSYLDYLDGPFPH